jgi:hypothetical protein
VVPLICLPQVGPSWMELASEISCSDSAVMKDPWGGVRRWQSLCPNL